MLQAGNAMHGFTVQRAIYELVDVEVVALDVDRVKDVSCRPPGAYRLVPEYAVVLRLVQPNEPSVGIDLQPEVLVV